MPQATPVRNLWAYVDETGDRGLVTTPGSSSIYGMACLLLDQPAASRIQAAVARLRQDFRVRPGDVMSWKRHLKTHERRKHAARVLSAIPGVTVIYIYYRKDAITTGTYHLDQQRGYDYIAHKMHKAILWATQHQPVRSDVAIRFGHVRHHDHHVTESYLNNHSDTHRLQGQFQRELKWVAANTHPESEAADFYAGFLKSAVWEDEFGDFEGSYLQRVWPQIRNANLCAVPASYYCAIPLGLLSMPMNHLITEHEWFPCSGCRHTIGTRGASGSGST